MGIIDTWSNRKRQAERAESADPLRYDVIPPDLRMQIMHVLIDTIGGYSQPTAMHTGYVPLPSNKTWDFLDKHLAKEFVRAHLGDGRSAFADFQSFFLTNHPVDQLLDCVELAVRIIDRYVRDQTPYDRRRSYSTQNPDDAINEINARFLQHGIGYQYVDGRIVRVDSELLHTEAVRPALQLLSDPMFAGPNQEFVAAFEHHRHGREKEAIREAANALESTLKTICDLKGWKYAPTDQAKRLLDIVFTNGLVPNYLQSEFTALQSVLESGLPTVRNKSGGHGQGATPVKVPDYLAAYALNLAASNIVLLISALRANP